jgi:hypothetical protein
MMDMSSNRNRHYRNVVAKHGKAAIVVGGFECSTEQFALDLEVGLIKLLRKAGVGIVNMTNGGEGVSGWKMPQDQKIKMINKLKGRVAPNCGKPSPLKGRLLSDDHKAKLSAAKIGKPGPRAGKKNSDEQKEKIAAAQIGFRWYSNGITETKCAPDQAEKCLGSNFRAGRLSAKRAAVNRSN